MTPQSPITPGSTKLEQHLTALGVMYIAFNVLGLVFGIGAVVVLVTVVWMQPWYAEEVALIELLGLALGVVFAVLAAPGIIGGIGLLKRKNWARILVIVLGFLNLINIPFGTALGIYTLTVLLKAETAKLFVGRRLS